MTEKLASYDSAKDMILVKFSVGDGVYVCPETARDLHQQLSDALVEASWAKHQEPAAPIKCPRCTRGFIRCSDPECATCASDNDPACPNATRCPACNAPAKCTRCDGCGQIANSDDGEPWSVWLNMPIGSSMAVLVGLVKPITCPACAGTGKKP